MKPQRQSPRFGILLNPQHYPGESISERVEEHRQQILAIEALGFDSIWDGQHFLSDYQELQPIPFLAWAAAHTQRVRIGTGILILPLYHPISVAEDLASLDILSAGRLIAGFGLGYRDIEFRSFGIQKATAKERLVEGVALIKRLWTEDNVHYEGRYFKVSGVSINPRPLQKPRPPIWIAANADPAVRRAARIGDTWFINPHATLNTLRRQVAVFLEERAASGNDKHPPVLPLMRELYMGDTYDVALREVQPFLEPKYEQYVRWGQQDAMGKTDRLDLPFEVLARGRFVIGDTERVVDEIHCYVEVLGITDFVFRVQWPGFPNSAAMSTLKLFGEKVLPRVK